MNKEHKIHYLNGGKFLAIYNPVKTTDIKDDSKLMIGKEIVVYQNCLNAPIQEDEYGSDWKNQYRFNSYSIHGWFPEEDITILSTLNEYVDFPESTLKYMYRMTYVGSEQIFGNFGKGYENRDELVVYRDYSSEVDSYVVNELSSPKAALVEKKVVDLMSDEESDWKVISRMIKKI